MPTGQNYSSTAVLATLTAGISNSSTTCTVNTVSGFPAAPFTLALDPGQANQEIVDVTNVTGLTLTITRAVDGSAAAAHSNNAQVMHAGIGRDFREARAHIDAAASNDPQGHSVHGITAGSSVVGTTDAQTLTNKTLTAPTLNNAVAANTVANTVPLAVNAIAGQTTGHLQDWKVNGTVEASVGADGTGTFNGGLSTPAAAVVNLTSGATIGPDALDGLQLVVKRGTDTAPTSDILQVLNAAGNSVLAKVQSDGSIGAAGQVNVGGLTGATTASRYVGGTGGGPPTTGTFVQGDWVVDTQWGINWICVAGGSPGTWRPSGQAVLGVSSPAAGSNMDFNSIPSYFKHLKIIGSAGANNATSLQDLDLQFNGDTASNYGFVGGFVSNVSTSGSGFSGINQNQAKVGILWGNANPEYGSFELTIPNYSNVSIWKQIQFLTAANQWNITTAYNVEYGGAAWHSTAAITSIHLFPAGGSGFLLGSSATLYGCA